MSTMKKIIITTVMLWFLATGHDVLAQTGDSGGSAGSIPLSEPRTTDSVIAPTPISTPSASSGPSATLIPSNTSSSSPTPILTQTPTPPISNQVSEPAELNTGNNSSLARIVALIAGLGVAGFIALNMKGKSRPDRDDNRCDGIKELLEQKKRELEDMVKNWPKDKVKAVMEDKITEQLEKDEDTKKILKIREKYNKTQKTIETLQKKYDLCMLSLSNIKSSVIITFFAHGTTTDNEKHISSGWYDVELSELGIEQSKKLTEQTKDKKFDVIFCSDQKRAIQSAKLSWEGIYPIVTDKRLRECNYGDYNAKSSEIVEPMQERMTTERFPNGESYEDVKIRIIDFLEFLKQNYDGKSVAIVAHKAPQLALDVLLKSKTWKEVFTEDWRKTKSWRPGWEYEVK